MAELPSRQTLDQVPGRVVAFILAVSKYPAIASILAARGYNQQEHDYAWERLAKLGTLPTFAQSAGTADKNVRDAMSELDAWDNPHFDIIRSILQRFYPAFIPTLFDNLEAQEGSASVLSVSTLLDRLDDLEKSADPDAPKVLQLLSDRTYTKAERLRLRDLVNTANAFKATAPVSDAERTQILTQLYWWITDWSTTAKAAIKRRQHLIALGIAAPRKSEKAKGEPDKGNKDPAAGGTGSGGKTP